MRGFKKRFNNISLSSLIIIALIVITVFFTWQNTALRGQIRQFRQDQVPVPTLSPEPTPTPTPIESTEPESDSERERDGCIITGCSGHICASEEQVTTCEFLQVYGCYADAICELQSDAQCGWTQTEELTQCQQNAQI